MCFLFYFFYFILSFRSTHVVVPCHLFDEGGSRVRGGIGGGRIPRGGRRRHCQSKNPSSLLYYIHTQVYALYSINNVYVKKNNVFLGNPHTLAHGW